MLRYGDQNYKHVGICIAEHHRQFSCIAGALDHPFAGVQHRSVWLGLKGPFDERTKHTEMKENGQGNLDKDNKHIAVGKRLFHWLIFLPYCTVCVIFQERSGLLLHPLLTSRGG